MTRRAIFCILACMAMLAVPASVMAATPPAGITGNVTVVNPPSAPVPVTGSVTATIPGGVNATVPDGVTVNNALSAPVPVAVQSLPSVSVSTGYHFVGYSTATTTGAAGGTFGMNAICETSFPGTSARICTTREFFSSPVVPTTSPPRAWIQPLLISVLTIPGETEGTWYFFLVDTTGYGWGYAHIFTGPCAQWTSGGGTDVGLTVDTYTGQVSHAPCSFGPYPVACCVP